jgi:hypothetical protein
MNDYTDHGCDPREQADEMDAYWMAEVEHDHLAREKALAEYFASLPTRDEVIAAANGEEIPF